MMTLHNRSTELLRMEGKRRFLVCPAAGYYWRWKLPDLEMLRRIVMLDKLRKITWRDVAAAIGCLLAIVLMAFIDLKYNTAERLVRKEISQMGYGELAESVTLKETGIEGVFRASVPIVDEESGELIEYWRVSYVRAGFSPPSSDIRVAEPCSPPEGDE